MNSKKRDIAFIIMLFVGMFFCIIIMSSDYISYFSNKDGYELYNVKIKNMEYMSYNGDRWAFFDFEKENIKIEGKVRSNWWEQEGDVIKIAVDTSYRFVRTEIIYDAEELSLIVFCIFMLIIMFIRVFKSK